LDGHSNLSSKCAYFHTVKRYDHMARVKFGSVVTGIKGKVGGQVFQQNRYGWTLRQKPIATGNNSASKSAKRQMLLQVSQHWRTLTDAQRIGWNDMAPSWPHVDPFGDPVQLTGYNLFCMVSLNLLTIGGTIVDAASLPATITALLTVDVSLGAAGGQYRIDFTPTPLVNDDVIIVWASPQVSAGEGLVVSKLKIIDSLSRINTSPIDASAAYSKVFPRKMVEGNKIHTALQVVSQLNGTAGPLFHVPQIIGP